jgi:tRNA-dihydrouridine synthase 3
MIEVQKEIEAEKNMKDTNTLKRKALEDPSLFVAASKKTKAVECNSDSENDEFFDAASEFTNVTIESAAAKEEEQPVGPIDTGYKKVKHHLQSAISVKNTNMYYNRSLILETRPILLHSQQ